MTRGTLAALDGYCNDRSPSFRDLTWYYAKQYTEHLNRIASMQTEAIETSLRAPWIGATTRWERFIRRLEWDQMHGPSREGAD